MEYIELGKIAEFVRGPFGGSLKKNIFVNDGIAVYEQQHAIYNQFDQIRYFIDEDKFNEMKRFEVKPNDIIMSCSGTMGKVAIVPKGVKKGIINQALLKITPSSKLDSRFLEYYMKSTIFFEFLNADAKGAAIKNVASVKELKKIPVMVIPLEEQQTIVAKLDQAFAAIDQAKANIEKNIANAKELFQSKLNQIFSQNGDGWVEKTLEKTFKLKSGDGLTSKMMIQDGEYPVYGGNNIAGYYDKFNFEHGVIVGRVGALCGNARFINEKVWITDNAFKLTEFKYEFDFKFLSYLLNFKNLRSYARQAAQPVISNSSLKDVILNFPNSIETQQQIVNQLDQLQEQSNLLVTKYQQKLANLEELKKSILEKAFKGELSTAAIEKV